MFEPKKPFTDPSLNIAEVQDINAYAASGNERTGWDTFDYDLNFD